MRRLVTFLRQPAVLLPVLFLTLTGFLGNWLTPEPRFVIRTGAVHDQYDQHRHKLGQVADDGGQVVILDQYMTENGLSTMFHNYWDPEWPIYRTRPTWWATHSATDETPRWWSDEAWVEHLPRFGDWQMRGLLSHRSGRELLLDEGTWLVFLQRFLARRTLALDEIRATSEYVDDGEITDLLPRSLRFSPDGQHVVYHVRDGLPVYWPVYRPADLQSGAVVFEDVKTGKQLATLRGEWDVEMIAFAGRTAILEEHLAGGKWQLVLWDLDTGARRAALPIPRQPSHENFYFYGSADSRYLLAHWWRSALGPPELRWWDIASATQLGSVVEVSDAAIIDHGRVLVTQMTNADDIDTGRLCFWDLATGQPLGEWITSTCQDGVGNIKGLAASASDRYLAMEYDSDYNRKPSTVSGWFAWIFGSQKAESSSESRHQVILLDVIDRRELARLPGSSAKLSPQGRWLATLDHAGVVRVWELPLRQPWLTAILYAGAVALACWLMRCLLMRWLRRIHDSGLMLS